MEETVSGFIPIGNGAPTLRWKMAASQTIKKGDPVILASGLVAIAVASSSTAILGFAAESVTSAASGSYYIDIWLATNNAKFKAIASTNVAITNFFTASALCFDLAGTTGAWTVNLAASTQDLFQIVGIPDGIEHGTLGTTCYIVVNKRYLVD